MALSPFTPDDWAIKCQKAASHREQMAKWLTPSFQNPVEIYLTQFHSMRALNPDKSICVIHKAALSSIPHFDAKYVKKYWNIYRDIAEANPTLTENKIHAFALKFFTRNREPLFKALKQQHPSTSDNRLEEWGRNLTTMFAFS